MRRMGRVCIVHGLPRRSVRSALAVVALVLGACGPIRYVGTVTQRASDAVDEARAAQAEKYAPYWWTRATQYLHKAREVAAHADFQGANRFGRLAADAAIQAAEDARLAASDPTKRPRDRVPEVAPAKTTGAPIAPARDLPVPAKEPPPPSKNDPRSPRIAPLKDPP